MAHGLRGQQSDETLPGWIQADAGPVMMRASPTGIARRHI